MFKKISLFTLLLILTNQILLAGGFLEIDESIQSKDAIKPIENIKKAFKINRGDAKLILGGTLKVEHLNYENAALLNSKIPDSTSFFKQTLDLTADLIYGKKKYNHKALELFVDIRDKMKWGTTNIYAESVASEVKISDSSLGDHKHKSSRPMLWIREGWLQASFNAIFDNKNEKRHFVKLGWFPFVLGRGISYGSNYGTTKRFIGIYSYHEDKYAPAIDIHGELIKNKLFYDLYYAKIEDKTRPHK